MNSKRATQIVLPKFVFLTAYKTSQFDKHAKEAGVSSVYEKPLSIEQLEEIFYT